MLSYRRASPTKIFAFVPVFRYAALQKKQEITSDCMASTFVLFLHFMGFYCMMLLKLFFCKAKTDGLFMPSHTIKKEMIFWLLMTPYNY